MSQAFKSKANPDHPSVNSGSEVDRGPNSSKAVSSSLLRPSARASTRNPGYKSIVHSYASMAATSNANDISSEPWMETTTPGKFAHFQEAIYNTIEKIVQLPENAEHPFTKKWTELKGAPKNSMSATISWHRVKSLLAVQDLFGYRDFLLQCPSITQYIRFSPSKSTKSGFDFGIYNRPVESILDNSTLPSSSQSIESPSTTETDSYVIDFSTKMDKFSKDHDIDDNVETRGNLKDDTSDNTQLADESIVIAPDIVLTPKQTNVNPLPQIVSVTASKEGTNLKLDIHDDIPADPEIAWSITDESPGFPQVHYRLFESITMWMKQDDAKTHPFHMKWQKVLYLGLQATSPWIRVAKILNIAYMKDYITFMYECPRIKERYDLTWDYFDNAIRYRELALPDLEDVNNDIHKLNAFQRQIQHMVVKFDAIFKDVEKRVDAVNLRTTACEENILNRVSTTFNTKVAWGMNRISDYAATSLLSFQQKVSEIVDNQLLVYSGNLAEMEQRYQARLSTAVAKMEKKLQERADELEKQFYQKYEVAMDVAIQDIHAYADEATDKFNEQVQEAEANLERLNQLNMQSAPINENDTDTKTAHYSTQVPQPSKRFPNVDVSLFTTTSQPKPDKSDYCPQEPESSQANPTFTQDWGKNGPDYEPNHRAHFQQPWHTGYNNGYTNQYGTPHTDGLPMVCHNDFLKRVVLPYPGREQSYTWYLQLKSNAQQYGIYLTDMEEFKKDKSLCPNNFHGTTIKSSRYHDMKCTLYHFLAQTSIISVDHHDLRNIINRCALNTDGYRVLYDIMERIHPALDPDAVFAVPQSKEYSSIHEYYLYVDLYYMHEKYAGRTYTPRAQLNTFLRGLDLHYHAAISRIRRIMDTWPINEQSVPETLQLANLPNLVEKYMEEETGVATIHRVQHQNRQGERHNRRGEIMQPDGRPDDTNRKFVDVKCPLCQSYGHLKTQCDRMAIWLNLKDASRLVDDKLRKTLSTNYANVDAARRAKKVSRIKGTVRQLYREGQFNAGDQLLDGYFLQQNQEIDHLIPNDNQASDSESSRAE